MTDDDISIDAANTLSPPPLTSSNLAREAQGQHSAQLRSILQRNIKFCEEVLEVWTILQRPVERRSEPRLVAMSL